LWGPGGGGPPPLDGPVGKVVVAGAELYLPLADVIDLDEERQRLRRELDKARAELERAERKLANESFVAKAPSDVVDAERDKVASWQETIAKLSAQVEQLGFGLRELALRLQQLQHPLGLTLLNVRLQQILIDNVRHEHRRSAEQRLDRFAQLLCLLPVAAPGRCDQIVDLGRKPRELVQRCDVLRIKVEREHVCAAFKHTRGGKCSTGLSKRQVGAMAEEMKLQRIRQFRQVLLNDRKRLLGAPRADH
jgi:hypothetical protein